MEENSASSQLEQTLTKPDIHHQWEQVFRTAANEAFYEQVFDFLVSYMALPPDALVLDAGCGIGAHTGQFTTLYGRSRNAFWQKIIHRFNQFWFDTIQWPQPAFGNILILKKTARIAD